jgi:D-3-phosphoglycerate dehydrogenase
VLDAAPRLKVISKWGTGIDSIDLGACKSRDIAVCNTPNAFTEPVADTVLGYILSFARNLLSMNMAMKSGNWRKIPSRSLGECTLGIIGVGNIGKAVARRAIAFGMCLLGNDIVKMPEKFLEETAISMVPLSQLLKEADFISVNCDLNPTSYHLLSRDSFDLVKAGAVLINTARGPIIDEAALFDALRNKSLAGAALDVFETEPLPADSPLLKMDNVLLAPHNANSSPVAWQYVHINTIRNLLEELNRRGI